tara:strand:- start:114 stop:338 length:225 start_codon:yes stop_codon:yes gene_type:complete
MNNFIVETGTVEFDNADEATATFSGSHKNVPRVTVTLIDGNVLANIEEVTKSTATIGLSSKWSGIAYYHAISKA